MLPDLARPVVVAPMAGGPSTTGLVVAAAEAGAVGFLAAGYRSPEAVDEQVRTLRARNVRYGLNIFVPMPSPADPAPLERYRRELQGEADRYGVELPPLRLHDDDHFAAKVDIAVDAAVPLVSFTFGVPDRAVVRALQAAGSAVLITVTSADEAARAAAVGPDAVIAQGGSAGAHSSTTAPTTYRGSTTALEVLRAVRAAVDLPVIATGGVAGPDDVHALLAAGAVAVQAGTMFLLAGEAATRDVHRAALTGGRFTETVVTRAFTGQPARGLRNRFTDVHSGSAPVGYPAIHHLTAPIRAAAAERGDPDGVHLWAGTGFAAARPGTVREIVERLSP